MSAVAREKLQVNGLPDETWLGWFGMHLLSPSIFEVLEEMIRDNVRDHGEFQLTRAQEIQRQREGYLALEMTVAERFDFGVPDDFVRSVQAFRETAIKPVEFANLHLRRRVQDASRISQFVLRAASWRVRRPSAAFPAPIHARNCWHTFCMTKYY